MDLKKLWNQFKIMIGLNVLDFFTTLPFLSKMGSKGELNPLVRFLIESTNSPYMIILLKIVTMYFLYVVIKHVLTKNQYNTLYYSMIVLNITLASIVSTSLYIVFKYGM